MYKLVIGLLVSCLSLVGCGNKDTSIDPTKINYNNTVIEYNQPIPENLKSYGHSLSQYVSSKKTDDISMVINKEGIVRAIVLNSDSVETVNGIKVGDSTNKVTSTYEYEVKIGDSYCVYFSGDEEIDYVNNKENCSNNTMCISYDYSGDVVSRIMIYDLMFSKNAM